MKVSTLREYFEFAKPTKPLQLPEWIQLLELLELPEWDFRWRLSRLRNHSDTLTGQTSENIGNLVNIMFGILTLFSLLNQSKPGQGNSTELHCTGASSSKSFGNSNWPDI